MLLLGQDMDATHHRTLDHRPPMFLVSTTPAARDIRNGLGTPAYSYYFAVEALAPVLEQLGAWRLIDRPESRLPYAAARAEADGYRPIHLSVNPLQDAYFCPGLPNLAFPFWEFAEIPDRDFGDDARQNWVRASRGSSLILSACEFTASAFRNANITAPVAVVPVPIVPEAFQLVDWDARHTWTLDCRHEVWGGPTIAAINADFATVPKPLGRARRAARAIFRRVSPWLRPETVDRLKRIAGGSPAAKSDRQPIGLLQGVGGSYRKHIRPMLSDRAVAKVTAAKELAQRLVGRQPGERLDPLLPSSPLDSGRGPRLPEHLQRRRPAQETGATCSRRSCSRFRDREDVTLVIQLVTSPRCEHHGEVELLRSSHQAMGIAHRCRVAVIPQYLDESQMADLFRATTYYVNTSHAEGLACP